jgi:GTPase KRas
MRDQYIKLVPLILYDVPFLTIYCSSGDGFLLVYSVGAKGTFRSIKELHKRILSVREAGSWPVVIAANKCDLPPNKREVTREVHNDETAFPKVLTLFFQQGEALAKELNCGFFETSAKERLNVEEAFRALAQLIDK